MIPEFPQFKTLEASDQEEIQKFTRGYPPYSDYNFVSLWCWGTEDNIKLSQLNQNLVMEFPDYITGKKFYSFFGAHKLEETIATLFAAARTENLPLMMKLIPEANFQHGFPKKFTVVPDRDNFDYVYSVERIRDYPGTKLSAKRNYVHQFQKKYTGEVRELNLRSRDDYQAIEKLFYLWAAGKKLPPAETDHEHKAISRLLKLPDLRNLCGWGLYIKNTLTAFWVLEVLDDKFAMSHFQKAQFRDYVGITPYFMQQCAVLLAERGVELINNEQDVGLPGLREAKEDYHPVGYLKKFVITPA